MILHVEEKKMQDKESIISASDKSRLIELLSEADKILDKYPYYNKPNIITSMTRTKNFVKEAYNWCNLLPANDNKSIITVADKIRLMNDLELVNFLVFFDENPIVCEFMAKEECFYSADNPTCRGCPGFLRYLQSSADKIGY